MRQMEELILINQSLEFDKLKVRPKTSARVASVWLTGRLANWAFS